MYLALMYLALPTGVAIAFLRPGQVAIIDQYSGICVDNVHSTNCYKLQFTEPGRAL